MLLFPFLVTQRIPILLDNNLTLPKSSSTPDNGAEVISGCIYHTRLVLSLQIPLSPGPWFGGDADEASALLKALSMQLNKTGWVEWALHPYTHPFPARQFTGWQWATEPWSWPQTVVILSSAGILAGFGARCFIDSELLALLGYTLPVWLQNKGCSSASFPFSCLSNCLVKPSGGRVSQPPGLHTTLSCVSSAPCGRCCLRTFLSQQQSTRRGIKWFHLGLQELSADFSIWAELTQQGSLKLLFG